MKLNAETTSSTADTATLKRIPLSLGCETLSERFDLNIRGLRGSDCRKRKECCCKNQQVVASGFEHGW